MTVIGYARVSKGRVFKAAGVHKGRPASIDADQGRKMRADGVGPTEIAEILKIGRPSVYRVPAG
jgi:DNA invertase Pin-like site-specific DNA recombinase